MTTAHRPTWESAAGLDSKSGSRQIPTQKVSARDLPGYLSLKIRQPEQLGPLGPQATKEQYKQALNGNVSHSTQTKSSKYEALLFGQTEAEAITEPNPFPQDADDQPGANFNSSQSESGSDDEDEAELVRELEKIKKERLEEEAKRKEKEELSRKEVQREQMLKGNPLLNEPTSALQRRWDDDVVFKNQAKGLPKPKKTYINDAVRSEFHKRFLLKYIA